MSFTGAAVEAQITFYGEADTLTASGVTMLSEMNIDLVLVVVQVFHFYTMLLPSFNTSGGRKVCIYLLIIPLLF